MKYFAHHYSRDKNARDKYRNNIFFGSCSEFFERWDQSSFDPGYASENLEYFEPNVRGVFRRKA